MRRKQKIVALGLVSIVLTTSAFAAETDPPASSEVTAAMQPYLDRYKLAGVIGIIADKRDDVYGGSLETRMRFPLEVFEAVRAVFPAEKPDAQDERAESSLA